MTKVLEIVYANGDREVFDVAEIQVAGILIHTATQPSATYRADSNEWTEFKDVNGHLHAIQLSHVRRMGIMP